VLRRPPHARACPSTRGSSARSGAASPSPQPRPEARATACGASVAAERRRDGVLHAPVRTLRVEGPVMRHETFSTPGPVALDLRIPAGEVAVEAATGLTETSVELEALRGEGAEELVEATRIECRPGRDGESEVVVEVPEKRRFGIFGDTAEVRLTLRCPDGARLGVRAASADLQARGRFSAADVQTASGDAEV